MKINKLLFFLSLIISLSLISSCSEDDHDHDHDHDGEEAITELVLTFTPTAEGDVVTATWLDADGEGTANPDIDKIELVEGTEYILTMTLANTLEDPDEDKTAEIGGEADEHMFFFGFTNDIFTNPAGNGNIDNRDDDIRYNDADINGFPLGLSTTWTAGAPSTATGELTVLLKHQPDEKSATSSSSTGGTDIEVDFPIEIIEDLN